MPTSIWRGWSRSSTRPASATTRWSWCCPTMARARRAGRSASSTRWGRINFRPEPIAEKLRRIDDIGGPDSHSNFPHGWAMASNTPLRRYKQNTHGGGIRDPFVMTWPKRIAAKGEVRHQFVHACDLTPTLLDLIGIAPPAEIARRRADADRGRELCALDHRSSRAVKILAAIFRDVRPSRDLAGRLEGGLLPSLGHAVRERQMGAVSPRRRIFRKPTISRRRSPSGSRR